MEVQNLIPDILMELILTAMSLHDILKRKVPVRLLVCMVIPVLASAAIAITGGRIGEKLIVMLVGVIPGALLILIGHITGKVGMADGIVLCALGILEGARGALVILAMGSLILSLVSMILLALKKVRRETRLPFIPFLGLGLLIWRFVFV